MEIAYLTRLYHKKVNEGSLLKPFYVRKKPLAGCKA